MPEYKIVSVIDGQPTFERPLDEILAEAKAGGALKLLDPIEWLTEQQRRWYKGVCIRGLVDWNGDSAQLWDRRLKRECDGLALLKKEILLTDNGTPVGRLTTKGVGKRNMTAFIERILEVATDPKNNWPVTPPDPELRRR